MRVLILLLTAVSLFGQVDPWRRDNTTGVISPRRPGDSVAISPTLPVTLATVSPQAVAKTGFFFNNAAGAMTFTLPAITASTVGNQYCFRNYVGKSGAITLQLPAATSVDVDGANGTAAATLVSSGALGDSACVVAAAVGQYVGYIGNGSWTKN